MGSNLPLKLTMAERNVLRGNLSRAFEPWHQQQRLGWLREDGSRPEPDEVTLELAKLLRVLAHGLEDEVLARQAPCTHALRRWLGSDDRWTCHCGASGHEERR